MKFSSALLFASVAVASPMIKTSSKVNVTHFGPDLAIPEHPIAKQNETSSEELIQEVRSQFTMLKMGFTNQLSVIESLLNKLEPSGTHTTEPEASITRLPLVLNKPGSDLSGTHSPSQTTGGAEASETVDASD